MLYVPLYCFSGEEELGKEMNTLLKMEQHFYKLLALPQLKKDMAISRWCKMTEEIFENWHLDVKTVFILFDIPAFSDLVDRETERAQNVVCILLLNRVIIIIYL